MPCVTFDKIEETDKTYFLHNDSYVFELPESTKEEQQKAPFLRELFLITLQWFYLHLSFSFDSFLQLVFVLTILYLSFYLDILLVF